MSSLMVIKRTGEVVDFDRERIHTAIVKAIRANAPAQERERLENDKLSAILADILGEIDSRFVELYPNVENIQDIVEKHLVKHGLYEIAKAYILYRAEHQKAREAQQQRVAQQSLLGKLTVVGADGRKVLFDIDRLKRAIRRAAAALPKHELAVDDVAGETIHNIYDGISAADLEKALLLACASFIERDPAYSELAARLFLRRIYKEVVGAEQLDDHLDGGYRAAFRYGLQRGVDAGVFDPRLLELDLDRLGARLDPERDGVFRYMGVQTLYERYFARIDGKVIETPQAFWMRVAMGLALEEDDREQRACQFYDLISSLRFVPSTPTLFHAGTSHPQLSSCYLTTIDDDLNSIFKGLSDNAQLSKWSGGLGNDWSYIRATGARISSTGVESQGVVPFLKIASDVTLAINRSGKRRGATCAYLETWHLDIEDFLDLRRNTGDERRRTHDMNTANWIPDLFMKRVLADEQWTLFSPDETPDLHDLYGRRFEERYTYYERLAADGKIARSKQVAATKLWRKMLGMLFETGHPWMTFKDPCNIRSPQDHVGVVHSSNLCTEITLNTSAEETAVCNLGSINLEKHLRRGADGSTATVDHERLAETVGIAMRMLDNVVDINFYPTDEARRSNLRHRPVGLGLMGLQDTLFALDVPFEDPRGLTVVDNVMETIAYHAILGSSRLAAERGTYDSYAGSKWAHGILPQDTLDMLEAERGVPIEVERGGVLDWQPVREHIAAHGMRNSNTMAIAPTATISNIAGCFPSFEPQYKNIFVKSNISGEFTVINPYLVADLRRTGLWTPAIAEQLKYHDGSVQPMTDLPEHLRRKYKVAFEIDPLWYLQLAAARGKWLDQSQSLNLFMQGTSGKLLSDIYLQAWKLGLKTTYYLRTMAASQVEKATLSASYGFTQKRGAAGSNGGGNGHQPGNGSNGGGGASQPAAAPAQSTAPAAAHREATATTAVAAAEPVFSAGGVDRATAAPAAVTEEPPEALVLDADAKQPAACNIDDESCEACQ